MATPASYTSPITGGHFRWKVTVKDFRDVEVPAGRFENCLRLDFRMQDTASGLEISRYEVYLAPGVGVVKQQGRFLSRSFKHLLTSHGYPWTPPGVRHSPAHGSPRP